MAVLLAEKLPALLIRRDPVHALGIPATAHTVSFQSQG